MIVWFLSSEEEIDNPRMRGRKLGKRTPDAPEDSEEIDNPRMRGRKPEVLISVESNISEEIDNPRMRGRKPTSRLTHFSFFTCL